jgi:hypothetical protein
MLAREGVPWADGFAALLRAGVASFRGDDAGTIVHLRKAIKSLDEAEMKLFSAAARYRMGGLLAGKEGEAVCSEARAWMTAQMVQDVDRMAELCVPCPRSAS